MAEYSIKDLEKLSGIKAHTIRIWEKRYGLLEPKRTDTNIRHYCDEDLKKILNVSSLVKSGIKISRVAALCQESIKEEILKLETDSTGVGLKIDLLIRSMINFDTHKFKNAIDQTFDELGTEEAFSKVIVPFMERIGILWQVGSIVPAHEHFVSSLIRNKLISESYQLTPKQEAKTVLMYLCEDEWHELSILYYNFIALKYGYNTIYLGTNLPFNDLKELNEKYNFEFVFSSFVNAITEEDLQQYLQNMAKLFANKQIFISGNQVHIHNLQLAKNVQIVTDSKSFIQALQNNQ